MYSVIIPCFNSGRTIKEALQSVANQTLKANEIFVIDDCSVDDTVAIALEFHLMNPDLNIEIIQNRENKGPSYSRNLGIDLSRSTLVAFLDSDDVWVPLKMQTQIRAMKIYGLDIVGSEYDIKGSKSKVKLQQGDLYEKQFDSKMCRSVTSTTILFKNSLITPTVVVLREKCLRFNTNARFSEDLDLWIRMLAGGAKAAVIKSTLVTLNKETFGISGLSSQMLKMELGELNAIRSHFLSRPIYVPLALAYSLCKYLRRIVIVLWRLL